MDTKPESEKREKRETPRTEPLPPPASVDDVTADRIQKLPYAKLISPQYSGYLNIDRGIHMHYW